MKDLVVLNVEDFLGAIKRAGGKENLTRMIEEAKERVNKNDNVEFDFDTFVNFVKSINKDLDSYNELMINDEAATKVTEQIRSLFGAFNEYFKEEKDLENEKEKNKEIYFKVMNSNGADALEIADDYELYEKSNIALKEISKNIEEKKETAHEFLQNLNFGEMKKELLDCFQSLAESHKELSLNPTNEKLNDLDKDLAYLIETNFKENDSAKEYEELLKRSGLSEKEQEKEMHQVKEIKEVDESPVLFDEYKDLSNKVFSIDNEETKEELIDPIINEDTLKPLDELNDMDTSLEESLSNLSNLKEEANDLINNNIVENNNETKMPVLEEEVTDDLTNIVGEENQEPDTTLEKPEMPVEPANEIKEPSRFEGRVKKIQNALIAPDLNETLASNAIATIALDNTDKYPTMPEMLQSAGLFDANSRLYDVLSVETDNKPNTFEEVKNNFGNVLKAYANKGKKEPEEVKEETVVPENRVEDQAIETGEQPSLDLNNPFAAGLEKQYANFDGMTLDDTDNQALKGR